MFGLTNSLISAAGIANAQQQSLQPNALSSLANQAFNAQYSQYQQQVGAYGPAQIQQMAAGLARHQTQHWMIDGRSMSFEQFLDEIAPGEDNSMRTFLILKYKK